jgi:hypothetical protein
VLQEKLELAHSETQKAREMNEIEAAVNEERIAQFELKCKSLMEDLDKAIEAINNISGVNESLLLETKKYNKIINKTKNR